MLKEAIEKYKIIEQKIPRDLIREVARPVIGFAALGALVGGLAGGPAGSFVGALTGASASVIFEGLAYKAGITTSHRHLRSEHKDTNEKKI